MPRPGASPSRTLAVGLLVLAGAAPTPDACASPAHTRSAGCANASPLKPGASTPQTLQSGGVWRGYLVHIPAGYRSTTAYPLILGFHGRGQTGDALERYSGLSSLAAIVVYPQGTVGDGAQVWEGAPYSTGADDVRFTQDLLEQVESQFCVDPDRVFATGKSNGGGFVALLACQLTDRIAAFAPVAGAYYPQSAVGCADSPAASIMEFHGTDDSVIHYDGGNGHGTSYRSVDEQLSGWAANAHCAEPPNDTWISADVLERSWLQSCAPGVEVVHYRVDGGGHTWPGAAAASGPGFATQTISATSLIWKFFQRHPLSAR